MRNLLAALFAASALAAAAPHASAQGSATHTILIDMSASNPLVLDADYAARLSQELARRLSDVLEVGDTVRIVTFGAWAPQDQTAAEQRISRNMLRTTPDDIAGLIASIPGRVEGGDLETQGSTNIVGAMTDESFRSPNCADGGGSVFVLSDGIENADGAAAGELGDAPDFAGCDRFVLIGLTGATPADTAALREEWLAFGAAAGFGDVDVVR